MPGNDGKQEQHHAGQADRVRVGVELARRHGSRRATRLNATDAQPDARSPARLGMTGRSSGGRASRGPARARARPPGSSTGSARGATMRTASQPADEREQREHDREQRRGPRAPPARNRGLAGRRRATDTATSATTSGSPRSRRGRARDAAHVVTRLCPGARALHVVADLLDRAASPRSRSSPVDAFVQPGVPRQRVALLARDVRRQLHVGQVVPEHLARGCPGRRRRDRLGDPHVPAVESSQARNTANAAPGRRPRRSPTTDDPQGQGAGRHRDHGAAAALRSACASASPSAGGAVAPSLLARRRGRSR